MAGKRLHEDWVQVVRAANKGIETRYFSRRLIEHVIAESPEGLDLDLSSDEWRRLAETQTRKEFDRRYMSAVGRDLGRRLQPDAFLFRDSSMRIIVFEVNITHRSGAEKYSYLASRLDCIDEWYVDVVTVDDRGICRLEPDPWALAYVASATAMRAKLSGACDEEAELLASRAVKDVSEFKEKSLTWHASDAIPEQLLPVHGTRRDALGGMSDALEWTLSCKFNSRKAWVFDEEAA